MKSWLVVSLFLSANAFAWGPTGHRVVGEIAQMHLSQDAQKAVKNILKGESLAQASNWSDEIKSNPKEFGHTFKWHYTDWPDEMKKHDESHSSGSLVASIGEQLKTLKDKKASTEKKVFALRFLVHLVGDVHMPLHVGNGHDRGGNYCQVLFHDNQTSLHALWDEGMLEFTKLSFTELTRFLNEKADEKEIQSWQKSDVMVWAQESKDIRASVYPDEVKKSKKKKGLSYCQKEVSKKHMPKLGYEYSYQFLPVAQKRLHQAGVRLALLLNENLK